MRICAEKKQALQSWGGEVVPTYNHNTNNKLNHINTYYLKYGKYYEFRFYF